MPVCLESRGPPATCKGQPPSHHVAPQQQTSLYAPGGEYAELNPGN